MGLLSERAKGRQSSPRRKDGRLGLWRKNDRGEGREPLPRRGFWCSPHLTDLVAAAAPLAPPCSPGTDLITISAVLVKGLSHFSLFLKIIFIFLSKN